MSLLQQQRAGLLSLALDLARKTWPDACACTTDQLRAWLGELRRQRGTRPFEVTGLSAFKRWPWKYGPSSEELNAGGLKHFPEIYGRGVWRLRAEPVKPEQWAWTTEHCEHWIGPSAYDATLSDAKSDGGNAPFKLAPVVPQQAGHFPPDADALLDLALARVRDEVYPDAEAFDVSTEQAADLERRINEAWAAWCNAHAVKLHCFSVDSSQAESWELAVCEACGGEGCETCDESGNAWLQSLQNNPIPTPETDYMKRLTILTTLLLLSTGCGLLDSLGWGDTCDPSSPAYLEQTEEQIAACEALAGTTGEDPESEAIASTELACPQFSPNSTLQFCTYTSTAPDFYDDIHVIDTADCASWGGLYPHVTGWNSPVRDNFTGRRDVWCAENGEFGAEEAPIIVSGSEWRLCPFFDTYHPATVSAEWSMDPGHDPRWIETARCVVDDLAPYPLPPGEIVAIGGYSADAPMTWTYTCNDDTDCTMPGGACQAGFWLDGLYPTPTLCDWHTGSGAPINPGGPSMYGLDSWADGITIRPGSWEMTSFMFDLASGHNDDRVLGLWNDDQAFEIVEIGAGPTVIEVTRCGAASLCTHVGLAVGDRLSFLDEDPRKTPVLVTIERVGGELESMWFEVSE